MEDFGGFDLPIEALPILSSDPAPITSYPVSVLDTGGGAAPAHGADWGALAAGGLSKLFDVFASTEAIKTAAKYGTMPGYVRVPGTNQVVPAGTYATMQAQSSNSTMLLMIALIGGAVLLFKRGG